jgi:glycosyltransferase involved in cell wall biosynthesis
LRSSSISSGLGSSSHEIPRLYKYRKNQVRRPDELVWWRACQLPNFKRDASRIMFVSVVIPALNEQEPIAEVVRTVAATGIPQEIVVADNGSTDETAARAAQAGARVIAEPRRGYGRACMAGVRAVSPNCNIVAFLDGDGSDCPEFMSQLIEPIARGTHDFVIGSRTRGQREAGSMNFQQVFAGRVAGFLVGLLYDVRYTDMSPFRAIRRDALNALGMREKTYGWNLEMQMRAARVGLRILEIPVNHRRRVGGQSKVSGTVRGTFLAGARIISTLLRIALEKRP